MQGDRRSGVRYARPVDEHAKRDTIERLRQDQSEWRRLVEEVGRDRMDEPGPMGEWTFRDLVGHLNAWRGRTVQRVEAAVRGEEPPPAPWPANLDDDDLINDWIHERDEGRSADELLAEYDRSFDRVAAALDALPDSTLTDPQAYAWTEGTALADVQFGSHLRDEHLPSIRAWLESRR
jgi:hypothetical protein